MDVLGPDVEHANGPKSSHSPTRVERSWRLGDRLLVQVGVGLFAGLAAIGWPFGSGALLNLDLVAIGTLDVPDSLLGGGVDVARRSPLLGLLALLSPPLGAASVTRLWMIAIVAISFVGCVRMLAAGGDPSERSGVSLAGVSLPIAGGAGLVYALSPFLLTRLAVGHLGFATAVALLPLSFAWLSRPFDNGRATLLSLSGFALCGYFGFLVALPVLAVGLVSQRRLPSALGLLVAIATQIPWLVPSLLRLGAVENFAGSGSFATELDSVGDLVRLGLGYGFWQRDQQLGDLGYWSIGLAFLLVVLAGIGFAWGRVGLRGELVALMVFGLAATVASRVPGVSSVWDSLTSFGALAPIRESHRLAVFAVLGVVVFSAHGLQYLMSVRSAWAARATGLVIAAAAVVNAGPDLGGLGGPAIAHPVPQAWDAVASLVESEPGPTLALPWHQYFDLRMAESRRVHTPLPFLIDGDVLYSTDPELDDVSRIERSGPSGIRADLVESFLSRVRQGDSGSEELDSLGLRWIVALPDVDGADIELLADNPRLKSEIDHSTIRLFAVAPSPEGASGVSTVAGGEHDLSRKIAAFSADGLWLLIFGAIGLPHSWVHLLFDQNRLRARSSSDVA